MKGRSNHPRKVCNNCAPLRYCQMFFLKWKGILNQNGQCNSPEGAVSAAKQQQNSERLRTENDSAENKDKQENKCIALKGQSAPQ